MGKMPGGKKTPPKKEAKKKDDGKKDNLVVSIVDKEGQSSGKYCR